MGPDVYAHKMKAYIDELISAAEEQRTATFTGLIFGLPWIMKNYPTQNPLHIYRNRENQWCSVLGRFRIQSFFARTREGFQDRVYHCLGSETFPVNFHLLEDYATSHIN